MRRFTSPRNESNIELADNALVKYVLENIKAPSDISLDTQSN